MIGKGMAVFGMWGFLAYSLHLLVDNAGKLPGTIHETGTIDWNLLFACSILAFIILTFVAMGITADFIKKK